MDTGQTQADTQTLQASPIRPQRDPDGFEAEPDIDIRQIDLDDIVPSVWHGGNYYKNNLNILQVRREVLSLLSDYYISIESTVPMMDGEIERIAERLQGEDLSSWARKKLRAEIRRCELNRAFALEKARQIELEIKLRMAQKPEAH